MGKIRSYLLIAIALLLVAGTCLTSCADVSAMSRSSLTGFGNHESNGATVNTHLSCSC